MVPAKSALESWGGGRADINDSPTMTDESPFAECHQEVDISAFVSTAIEGEAEL